MYHILTNNERNGKRIRKPATLGFLKLLLLFYIANSYITQFDIFAAPKQDNEPSSINQLIGYWKDSESDVLIMCFRSNWTVAFSGEEIGKYNQPSPDKLKIIADDNTILFNIVSITDTQMVLSDASSKSENVLHLKKVDLNAYEAAIKQKMNANIGILKEQRSESDIQAISMQLRTYEMLNYRKPTTEQGLKALVQEPTSEPKPRKWKPLMKALPVDPWGNEYVYRNPGKLNPDSYDLYSLGADGKEDTRTPELNEAENSNLTSAKQSTAAEGPIYSQINEAFGKKLGDVFDITQGEETIMRGGEVSYDFKPINPAGNFNLYRVVITPKTRRIYSIIAQGNIGSGQDENDAINFIVDQLTKKYGPENTKEEQRRSNHIFINGDRQILLGTTGSNYPDVDLIILVYKDNTLEKMAEKEKLEMLESTINTKGL